MGTNEATDNLIFVYVNGQERGPFSAEDVKADAIAGGIPLDSFWRHNGSDEVLPLSDLIKPPTKATQPPKLPPPSNPKEKDGPPKVNCDGPTVVAVILFFPGLGLRIFGAMLPNGGAGGFCISIANYMILLSAVIFTVGFLQAVLRGINHVLSILHRISTNHDN